MVGERVRTPHTSQGGALGRGTPWIVAAIMLLGSLRVVAAQAPATDIFLADVTWRDGVPHIANVRNATQRDGYDNQPWFLPDGASFLYSSERDGQTDIFRYDVRTATSTRITDTPENEYSPTLQGERLIVVRWPTDMTTGALWWFTPGGEPLEEVRGSVARVGYYTFVGDSALALFINDDVQSFMLSDVRTGVAERIGQGMNGSAPRAIPGERAVSFQQRDENGDWWLMRYDVAARAAERLVRMVGNVPNYTWTGDGAVLAATGSSIHMWRRGAQEWVRVADFSEPELQRITRIAITADGGRIAFVSARPEE
jgi:Tol biopolymer transport system component